MSTDYAARVAKGVALLDEKRPGWERELDLDRLDIADGTRCVTAQLSGKDSWLTGMRQLGLEIETYTEHGFRAPDEEYEQGDPYATLNTLWREVITERLSAPQEG
jgi:hypothetical protein